ncbi:flagellin [Clostridium botulinum]|uniref:flagellin N-terminal helical domain-containing protein n=1 Tax=Clostridium sp. ZBS13 TaxID=2949971 RepID=UPI001DE6C320|nr:flagellin [Clostridium sp. ZBS13]MBN1039999.1 flagellin [Clostridium botulinum]MBN1046837.1 flagellin [Clostridium botulinum]
MIINHNMNALNAHRQMMGNVSNSGKAMEKLSSGLRINRAGDDAAGLAISEKMRGQIRGLDQATRNSQDGISMIQTAEGSLNETQSILQRMKELATQAASDTNTEKDRGEIQNEINQLTSEINRIGNTTEFNTQKVLDGGTDAAATKTGTEAGEKVESATAAIVPGEKLKAADLSGLKDLTINGEKVTLTEIAKLGTGGDDAEKVAAALQKDIDAVANLKNKFKVEKNAAGGVDIKTVATGESATLKLDDSTPGDLAKLGLKESDVKGKKESVATEGNSTGFATEAKVTNGTTDATEEAALDMSSHASATAAIKILDEAIAKVSTERSTLGAYQNRLEHTINNLGTSSENLSAAESRIRDVDMAKEMMNFSKNNILSQASQAMLAQAKSQPEAVLQLLR